MINLKIKDKHTLSKTEITKVFELLIMVWSPVNNNITLESFSKGYKSGVIKPFNKVILSYDNKKLVGHAEVFQREIITNSMEIPILALAGVCVNQSYRGKNIGYNIVKEAFKYVDDGTFKLSIFQTTVPEFYFKLNCKLIHNKFINSKSTININLNPWRDPNVMIYPHTYDIGNAIIDLNGECY